MNVFVHPFFCTLVHIPYTHSFAHSNTHTDILLIGLSTQLYIEQSKAILSLMSSKACVAKMTATGRLHCDVFGSLSSSKTGNRKKSSTKDNKNRVTASMIETNKRHVSTRSLSISGDDWLSDTASLEDLFEEAGRDSIIPRNRRASLADSRSSSMVLSRDSSGKRQQEMIDLLLDLDPA